MEVASYVAITAPPVFSQGVEEARKDTLARQTIPQPNNTQNSASSGETGSQGTTGANSALYAQSEGMIRAVTERNAQKEKKESAKAEGKAAGAVTEAKGAVQRAAASSVSGASYTQSTASSASSAAAASASGLKTAQNEGKVEKEQRIPAYAKFSETAAAQNTEEASLASAAIAKRYNSSQPDYSRGSLLNMNV